MRLDAPDDENQYRMEDSAPEALLSKSADADEKAEGGRDIALPDHAGGFAGLAGSGSLDRLVDTARDYAAQATAENTTLAYKKDWAHFNSWCRRKGAAPLPPSSELIGLYIADCAAPQDKSPPLAVSTIERRLSGLGWHYQQRGFSLNRKNRHIATVLAGIRRKHARPRSRKKRFWPRIFWQ